MRTDLATRRAEALTAAAKHPEANPLPVTDSSDETAMLYVTNPDAEVKNNEHRDPYEGVDDETRKLWEDLDAQQEADDAEQQAFYDLDYVT